MCACVEITLCSWKVTVIKIHEYTIASFFPQVEKANNLPDQSSEGTLPRLAH